MEGFVVLLHSRVFLIRWEEGRRALCCGFFAPHSMASSQFLLAQKCVRVSRALLVAPPSPRHILVSPHRSLTRFPALCLARAALSAASDAPKPQPKTAKADRNAREEIRRLDEEVRRLQKERKLVGKGRESASSPKTKNDSRGSQRNSIDNAVGKRKGGKSDVVINSRNASSNQRNNRARAVSSYHEDDNIDDEFDEDEMDENEEDEDEEDDIDEELEELGEDFSSDAEMFMETTEGNESSADENETSPVKYNNPALRTTRLIDKESGTSTQGQSPSMGDAETCDSNSTYDKPSDELESVKHPWKEWNAFFDVLKQSNYFKDVPELTSAIAGNGYLRFQSSSHMKHAILEFSRERDDIIRFLTKKHIRTVVNVGCPVTDRKVVNASKRLRVMCEVPEEEVCQQCKLKTFCTRAFAAPSPDLKAETVDVTRVLYAFALNASPIAESQVSYPITVIKSACHLLDEIVQVSAYPKDPRAPAPKSRLPVKPTVIEKDETDSRNPNRRPGDWTCPDCNFLNFSKNRECRECGTYREASNPLEPGDWECPKCTFVNFRRNKECRDCLTPRPQGIDAISNEKMMPGDWKCPECQFLNFRKNSDCRKCSARRPINNEGHEVEDLEPGDWKCPGCSFINFKKNKQCKECGRLCPAQSRSDEQWGLKKPLTVSRQSWGSTKTTLSLSDAGFAGSRNKYQEWKPDLSRKIPKDSDDDLEEDADVVFKHDNDEEDGDTPLKSSRTLQRSTRSGSGHCNDDSELFSDFDFSDQDKKPTKKANRKLGKPSRHAQNRKIVIEEDEDDDNDMENELNYFEDDVSDDESSLRSASMKKSVKGRGFRNWGDDDEDEDDDDDEDDDSIGRGRGRGRGLLGRGGRNNRGRGSFDSSEGSDNEGYSRGRGRGGRGGMRGRGGRGGMRGRGGRGGMRGGGGGGGGGSGGRGGMRGRGSRGGR